MQVDVTPTAIQYRKREILVRRIMEDLAIDSICHYTEIDGSPNDNYRRVEEIIRKHLISVTQF